MADKKDAVVLDFVSYQKRRMNERDLPSVPDRGRHRKMVQSKRVPTSKKAYNILLGKIARGDHSINGVLGRFFESQGYSRYASHEDRQIYTKGREDDILYIMNRDFVTDEPSICVIAIDDFEEEVLERRLLNTTYGSVARVRYGRRPSRASEIIPLAMGSVGAIVTAVTYIVSDLESAAAIGSVSMGLPAVAYFIAKAANKNSNKGILPYSTAKRQVVAVNDLPKFFETAFGVEDLLEPDNPA